MVVSSVIAGASGGALANVALSPLGGGAGMLQSYWYGAGLILGERMMYTMHWEKMKARLDKGEDFLSVLESEMNPSITAIANYSLTIMKRTGELYLQGGIDFMAQLIENMFKLVAGESLGLDTTPPPTEPVEPPLVTCPAGFRWSISAQQCVPEDISEPPTEPIVDPLIDDSPKIDIVAELTSIIGNFQFVVTVDPDTPKRVLRLSDQDFRDKLEADFVKLNSMLTSYASGSPTAEALAFGPVEFILDAWKKAGTNILNHKFIYTL